ncbi:hypothetical protein ACF061_31035 [Streptomyces sp. NPDC015220]|uniref:hypothetical protein n=1 Tax=Streptomyces sp. NPDC015220 TaxID=3364947 RepID=UPI003700985E
MSSIAHAVRAERVHDAVCSTCERLSFRYDAELFCSVCKWLVPDVNERLAERYAANDGTYAPDKGTCPGCRRSGAGPALDFPITCPGCGAGHRISQRDVNTTSGAVLRCDCRFPITIPADVWCPGCRLNLRNLQKITALIKKANEPDSQVGDNVKEPPLDRTARRVIGLASAGERWSRTVSPDRQSQMLDGSHLDMLLFNDGQIADWIIDQVKLRSLGHRLHRDGGMALMAAVAERVGALDRSTLRLVEYVWDGIGDWQR